MRVIDAFMEGLNMEAAGFRRSAPNETGRPSYDPRDLLKLYVYGYFNKIRSSRKLMAECTRNSSLGLLLLFVKKRTGPTWPTTWFAPRLTGSGAFADVYSVMANWGADLITLRQYIPLSLWKKLARAD